MALDARGPGVTTLDELLPLVAEAKTAKEFGRIVLEHVPTDLKHGLARAARDALGRTWTDRTLGERLQPGIHTKLRADTCRKASLAYLAIPENRAANRKASREASLVHKRTNRLDLIVHSCRRSSEGRGHLFKDGDEAHLRALWIEGEAGRGPRHGFLDFNAFGVGRAGGDPWAPSPDRVDNSRGYHAGNVRLVPNVWNKTCNQYGRRLVAELTAEASRMRVQRLRGAGDVEALRSARPRGYKLHTYLAGNSAFVFRNHPALIPFQAEMLALTEEALYGSGGGVCAVTGLPFVAEPGHPCFPSWDLVNQFKTGRRAGRKVVELGTERPEDMRLVCVCFNFGRSCWEDAVWWKMADRVRELVDAGRIDEL